MAGTAYRTIVIQVANEQGDVTRRESLAEAAVTPGDLLNFASATTVQPHNAAAGVLQGKLVALETQTPDSETAHSIDTDYDVGDVVYYAEGKPGDVFYMWLADGQTAVMNPPSQLQSDGAGALNVVVVADTTLVNSIVGVAEEALDNSVGGAPARIKVRIV